MSKIEDFQQLGRLFMEERKRQGILKQDLADPSGISLHFLSNLENGKATVELRKTVLLPYMHHVWYTV